MQSYSNSIGILLSSLFQLEKQLNKSLIDSRQSPLLCFHWFLLDSVWVGKDNPKESEMNWKLGDKYWDDDHDGWFNADLVFC